MESALSEQALPYWEQAGQSAVERSAYVETVGQLNAALALLKTLPESPEHVLQKLVLQRILGSALMPTKGYRAPAVEKT
jgi:predicted ATPase